MPEPPPPDTTTLPGDSAGVAVDTLGAVVDTTGAVVDTLTRCGRHRLHAKPSEPADSAPLMTDPRSRIPSVDALMSSSAFAPLLEQYARSRVVAGARAAVERVRDRVASGAVPAEIEDASLYAPLASAWLEDDARPSLRPVINATGVVLHTNLGRAPLAEEAVEAMRRAGRSYSNLEYDLHAGARGSRYDHCVDLVRELTGAEDALVVNNAAAALVLALNTAALGAGVAVSRGELVEIGGGFRIPEVLVRAGARLVEVGSTNRTRVADYAEVVGQVEALLKVHRSNFSISGFTEDVEVADLVAVGRERGVPVVYDLGSGLMVPPQRLGLPDEPLAATSIQAGADVVVFSGDKLLGGPQAGIVAGRGELVQAMRKNPLCRALRVDKVTLAGLEATLRLYRDTDAAVARIPILRMLGADSEEIRARAEGVAAQLGEQGVDCSVAEARGAVGGGTMPGAELTSWAVRPDFADEPDRALAGLRKVDPPIVGRIVDDAVTLDLRTVLPGQEADLVRGVAAAFREGSPG